MGIGGRTFRRLMGSWKVTRIVYSTPANRSLAERDPNKDYGESWSVRFWLVTIEKAYSTLNGLHPGLYN
jgi:hypothetical protein